MIKQTMAVLLLSTGLASVAQAQSVNGLTFTGTLSGVPYTDHAINGISTSGAGFCRLGYTNVDGFSRNLLLNNVAKPCSEITWGAADAYVQRVASVSLNNIIDRSVFVSQGNIDPNAPDTIRPGIELNREVSTSEGYSFTTTIYDIVGNPDNTLNPLIRINGDAHGQNLQVLSGSVTGNGDYRRDDTTYYRVAGYSAGVSNADFTGVRVTDRSSNGGQVARIGASTGGNNCAVRTGTYPHTPAAGNLLTLNGACSDYTWRSLDATLSYAVTGVAPNQLDRPILSGIDLSTARDDVIWMSRFTNFPSYRCRWRYIPLHHLERYKR